MNQAYHDERSVFQWVAYKLRLLPHQSDDPGRSVHTGNVAHSRKQIQRECRYQAAGRKRFLVLVIKVLSILKFKKFNINFCSFYFAKTIHEMLGE